MHDLLRCNGVALGVETHRCRTTDPTLRRTTTLPTKPPYSTRTDALDPLNGTKQSYMHLPLKFTPVVLARFHRIAGSYRAPRHRPRIDGKRHLRTTCCFQRLSFDSCSNRIALARSYLPPVHFPAGAEHAFYQYK